jgi:hypothetical protein
MDNEIKEDGAPGAFAGPAVNAMGSSSSTAGTGGIDTFDPLMKFKNKKKLRNIVTRKPLEKASGAK